MIDYQQQFHTGFLVGNLEDAMDLYARSLGLRWASPYTYEALNLWTPERGAHQIRLDVAYSIDGPQHLEIQVGPSGSIYDVNLHSGHHVGYWVEDVTAASRQLVDCGWTPVVAACSPEDGFGGFAYFRPPHEGLLVEVVSTAARPRFENWWNGAPGPIL